MIHTRPSGSRRYRGVEDSDKPMETSDKCNDRPLDLDLKLLKSIKVALWTLVTVFVILPAVAGIGTGLVIGFMALKVEDAYSGDEEWSTKSENAYSGDEELLTESEDWGPTKNVQASFKSVEIADPIVEKEIRRQIRKYTGELTEADIKRVKNLEFIHSSITNEGVKEVAKLKQLEKLSLSHTKITDEWLKEVIKLPKLRGLGLWDTKITDAGLKEVVKLKHLYYLNLGGTKITDAGLKELAKLKNLTDLNLRYTRITKAGLKELAKCKQLEKLHLGHTQITDTTELQKALPNCKISD